MKIRSIALLLISLSACTSPERLDTSALKSTMEGYKIKRISSAQILAEVNQIGDTLSKSLNQTYLQQKEPSDYTNKFVDSLTQQYQLKIRLLTEKDLTTNNALFQKEKEVLEAYSEANKQGVPLEANIQKIEDSLLIYTAPLSTKGKELKIWSIVMRKNVVIQNTNFQKYQAKGK